MFENCLNKGFVIGWKRSISAKDDSSDWSVGIYELMDQHLPKEFLPVIPLFGLYDRPVDH